MNVRRVVLFVLAAVLALSGVPVGSARPATDDANALVAADAQILSEIRDHSQAMDNLEYLSDEIGPRLTGSPQLKQANDWTAAKFREYGLVNVKLEPWTIAHSWTRGMAHARIVIPAEHPLTIAAAGWSPSTVGVVRGPVVYFDAKTKEDFETFRGKLKGAIVIYQEPASLSPPKPETPNAE
jgi:carboxypeptidase Q